MAKEATPSGDYYDRPYLPSAEEASEYASIPLLPVEAHTILVDKAGLLSALDQAALEEISGSEDPDVRLDLKDVKNRLANSLDLDNDWN